RRAGIGQPVDHRRGDHLRGVLLDPVVAVRGAGVLRVAGAVHAFAGGGGPGAGAARSGDALGRRPRLTERLSGLRLGARRLLERVLGASVGARRLLERVFGASIGARRLPGWGFAPRADGIHAFMRVWPSMATAARTPTPAVVASWRPEGAVASIWKEPSLLIALSLLGKEAVALKLR